MTAHTTREVRRGSGAFSPALLVRSLPGALRKLNPITLARNPVMLVVEIGSVLTTLFAIVSPSVFGWTVTVWLWATVVFANLAEAVAEGRGKAQAATLRSTRTHTQARRLVGWSSGSLPGTLPRVLPEEPVSASELMPGDLVVVEAGQIIPGDGDVVTDAAIANQFYQEFYMRFSESGGILGMPDHLGHFPVIFNIFPVPANDVVNISFLSGTPALVKIRITDVTGKIITENMVVSSTGKDIFRLSLADIPQGIYFISLFWKAGFIPGNWWCIK